MKDLIDVMILVDHHQRHITLAGVWKCNSRILGDVNNGTAVECIAVHAGYVLFVDRSGLTIVPHLFKPPVFF